MTEHPSVASTLLLSLWISLSVHIESVHSTLPVFGARLYIASPNTTEPTNSSVKSNSSQDWLYSSSHTNDSKWRAYDTWLKDTPVPDTKPPYEHSHLALSSDSNAHFVGSGDLFSETLYLPEPSHRPQLIDSMTALSRQYILPPLTAALPMDQFVLTPGHSDLVVEVNKYANKHSAASHQYVPQVELESPPVVQYQNLPEQSLPHYVEPQHQSPLPPPPPPSQNDLPYEDTSIPGIPGKPWKDFPLFSQVPVTKFNCGLVQYGYYADIETGCQVWHYCQPDGRHNSFLCPNGTIFNQATRVCDWWYNVDCAGSIGKYDVNRDLYQEQQHKMVQIKPHSIEKRKLVPEIPRTYVHKTRFNAVHDYDGATYQLANVKQM